MATFEEMTDEERKAVYDETYKDVGGCCYSGCVCDTCGACPCDMSC